MMVSMFFCGDVVNYTHSDGLFCSTEISQMISSADYSVCNFEAPIMGYGRPQPKYGVHHAQVQETVSGLKRQGFDMLLMANNHIMDYGPEALKASLDRIRSLELDSLGAGMTWDEAYRPFVKNINGMTFGMLNACEAQFGVLDYSTRFDNCGYAWINHSKIEQIILDLKKKCDFVIAFVHAGLEHYPIPQQEWRERYRHFCDLGVDVVVGGHPHVPQGYEFRSDSVIFYSLGNFYFDSEKYLKSEDSSYGIWLQFKGKGQFTFRPVFYCKRQNVVDKASESKKVDLKKLCNLLEDRYFDLHTQMSLDAYKEIKRKLKYCTSFSPLNRRPLGLLREIASVMTGKNKYDKKLLNYHLFRNETYCYAARDALRVLYKESLVNHE